MTSLNLFSRQSLLLILLYSHARKNTFLNCISLVLLYCAILLLFLRLPLTFEERALAFFFCPPASYATRAQTQMATVTKVSRKRGVFHSRKVRMNSRTSYRDCSTFSANRKICLKQICSRKSSKVFFPRLIRSVWWSVQQT